jgi:IclR family acetate operon transcriptional repressor
MKSKQSPNLPDSSAGLHVSQSANRALTLLDAVVSNGSMSLGDAATFTGEASSTALRHLRALTAAGWLSRDPFGQYSGGPTLMRIALRSMRTGPYAQLQAAAQPFLHALVEATNESAYLAIRDGSSAVYISTVESERSIRHVGWVGQEAPILGTAIGAALTADPAGNAIPVEVNTGASEPDVTAVTAPIFDGDQVAAAFSILGPAERLDPDQQVVAAAALRQASQALSTELRRD